MFIGKFVLDAAGGQLASLNSRRDRILARLQTWRSYRLIRVPMRDCVHYGGFRYGRSEYNPYESYAIRYFRERNQAGARSQLIYFLRHYRPRDLAAALGVGILSQPYPLWLFPWDNVNFAMASTSRGWEDHPDNCSDIMTQFCKFGVSIPRINEEFEWIEEIFHSIMDKGFRPFRIRPFIAVKTFFALDGRRSHLVLDGNHRVASLSALGTRSVFVRRAIADRVFECDVDEWPGVKCGYFTRDDALKLFYSYFDGNHAYRTTEAAADLIEIGHRVRPAHA